MSPISALGCLPSTSISHWYCGDSIFTPARSAFNQALATFERCGRKDPIKKDRLRSLQATSLSDLLHAVTCAQQTAKRQPKSMARKHMEAVAQGIHHYGNIFDVLAQHHPEYVALAWGMMKLLVGKAIAEHERIGQTISKGLLDIADSLPRVDIASSLYPTKFILQSVVALYAHIIRCFIQALEWYEEGSWKRALHSVTKPAVLRYGDVLDDIRRVTEHITAHASASSQAEQHDMHKELITIRTLVETGNETNTLEHNEFRQKLQLVIDLVADLKEIVRSDQVIAHDERAQIYRTLSAVQPIQVINIFATQCSIDHQACFQDSSALRKRRQITSRSSCFPFWNSSSLQSWNQSPHSSVMFVKAPFSDRQPIQGFCTNVIEQLLAADIAILWVLKGKDGAHSVTDTLKSLVQQALSISCQTKEDEISTQIQRCLQTQLNDHYLDVLSGLISHVRTVYILVQLEAVQSASAAQFVGCLQNFRNRISSCGSRTVLRVLILNCSPGGDVGKEEGLYTSLQVRKAPRRKRRGIPDRPFRSR